MNTKDKIQELGMLGEKIIINRLSKKGHIVESSIDKYDRTKDLMIDGKLKAEVKTQVPFILENAFTFKSSQLTKCRNVDVLYFISVPPPNHDDKWAGWVFEANPQEFKVRQRKTRDGREMLLIDREQEALKPIAKLSDEEIFELKKYTVSGY